MELKRAVPILTVPDVSAAVATYRQVLGLDVLMDLGWIVTLGSGTTAQFSLMTKDLKAPCNPEVSLEVADVDAAHSEVVAAGHEVVHPLSDEEWGVRRFFFRDPAGHVVNVLSHT